ncbi:MAG: hypothetical protein RTU09_00205 [Candidatus Thorarchaeota archaeon]
MIESRKEFDAILEAHRIPPLEIRIGGPNVSKIGVPPVKTLLAFGGNDFGRKVIAVRLLTLAIYAALTILAALTNPFGTLSSLDPFAPLVLLSTGQLPSSIIGFLTGYAMISISCLVMGLCYLGLDFVVLWLMEGRNPQPLWIWLLVTTAITVMVGVFIGSFSEIIFTQMNIVFNDPTPSIDLLMVLTFYMTFLAFMISTSVYRRFLQAYRPDFVLSEAKIVAIRKCLLARKVNKPLETYQDDRAEAIALSKIMKLAVGKGIVLFLIGILAGWLVPYLGIIIGEGEIIPALIAIVVGSYCIALVTAILSRRLSKGNAYAEDSLLTVTTGTMVMGFMTSFIAYGFMVFAAIYTFGIVCFFQLILTSQKTMKGHPEILGHFYYEALIPTMAPDEALTFFTDAQHELNSVLPTIVTPPI